MVWLTKFTLFIDLSNGFMSFITLLCWFKIDFNSVALALSSSWKFKTNQSQMSKSDNYLIQNKYNFQGTIFFFFLLWAFHLGKLFEQEAIIFLNDCVCKHFFLVEWLNIRIFQSYILFNQLDLIYLKIHEVNFNFWDIWRGQFFV